MHLAQHIDANVSVDLCGSEIGVPQHHLDIPNVSPVSKHVRRARMPKRMARATSWHTRSVEIFLDEIAEPVLRQRLTVVRQEQRVVELVRD